jgi:glycosyltransferase involved in cell wall biosynthesis
MGSAHRDYPTLIQAVDVLNIPTVIVTRESDISRLPQSPFVTFKSGLTERECFEMLAKARISVTPIANLETASGQTTFIAAMHIGVPVIATACPGTEGYIEHRRNGILLPPLDVDAMKDAVADLWNDKTCRVRLSSAACAEAMARFSDKAAGKALHEIVLEAEWDRSDA